MKDSLNYIRLPMSGPDFSDFSLLTVHDEQLYPWRGTYNFC